MTSVYNPASSKRYFLFPNGRYTLYAQFSFMAQIRIVLLLVLTGSIAHAQSNRAMRDFEKAREHARSNEYGEALEDLNEAIEDSPEFINAYLFKAELLQRLDRKEEAVKVYEAALSQRAPYYVSLYYGRLLFELGRYAEAEGALKGYAMSDEAKPKYLEEVNKTLQSIAFAKKALKTPKPYNPKNLGPKVNSDQLEYFPSISADGNTLVFTHRKLVGPEQDEDFWVTIRDSAQAPWQKAQKIRGFLNTPDNEGAQSLSADGQVIFFAGCNRPDGFGSCDIYASFLQADGTWGKAINLGPTVNTGRWESQPSISSDGLTLYFVRGRDGTDRNLDIYQSTFTRQGWTKAERVPGDINTQAQETSPFIHFDNQSLYFSSNGHPGMGDLDFFVSRKRPDGKWGTPQNLGHPINTSAQEFSLIVGPDGKTGFFSSDAIDSGYGRLDLYEFSLPDSVQAKPVAYLRGKVIDKKTREPLSALIEFGDLDDSSFTFNKASDRNGAFYAVLPAFSEYALSISKKGYLFYSQNFKMKDQGQDEALFLQIELIPIEVGQSVKLENVFFNFDSYKLQKRSYTELEKVVEFLNANPQVEVSIEGHTDNQGSDAYNKNLSANRAESVYEYLKSKGIAESRMRYEGFGASAPIAENTTEEGRALNRRTEMRILANSK